MQENENQKMLKEINEIKSFLEDYGLHWIGGAPPEPPTYPNGPIDMDLFNVRISTLNEGSTAMQKKLGFQKQSEIPHISIYLEDNGFHIDSKPLRKYGESESDLFFMDIYDGFFPSEFHSLYPHGIFLKCFDNRHSGLYSGEGRKISEEARINEKAPQEDEGQLKIKLFNGSEIIENTKPNQKIRQIWRIIATRLDRNDFEITTPPSLEPLDDDATLKSLNLFPRGIIHVILNK